jgi:4-amino-4-deoxy-L-arabinose transferase-like glycosyltransferase
MRFSRSRWLNFLQRNDVLMAVGLISLLTLFVRNGDTGWHRDELDMLDNARHLAWGYVSYPPLSPLLARLGLALFGPSLIGVRLLPALARAIGVVLTGLMARELGGRRWAEALAAIAALVAPIGLLAGVLFSYSSFDYLWWVCSAYFVIRLLKSEDGRWWLAIGAALGLGAMTKYTVAYLLPGMLAGLALTPARKWLLSRWLWAGVGLAVLIVLPNLIWQVKHGFVSLDFLQSIHARDVRQSRTDAFLLEQIVFATHPLTLPIWVSGLYFFLAAPAGRRFRMLGWMFIVPFTLFYLSQGRSYYIAAAYASLFAGGAVALELGLSRLSLRAGRWIKGCALGLLSFGGMLAAPLALPVLPIDSEAWETVSEINGELNEQVGWPELVAAVAGIYQALPEEEQARAGILTGNYGEAGAVNLYGPALGLPTAISGINSYWGRGYGDPPPERLIVLGFNLSQAARLFQGCQVAGRATNPYGLPNEESRDHPAILLCGPPHRPWPQTWEGLRSYG